MKATNITTRLLALIFAVLALASCNKNDDDKPPVTPTEKTAQTWAGTEYTIKTPIEKGDITLSVSANVDGAAKLIIPAGLNDDENPSITITLAEGASFTGSLTINNANYEGDIILKVAKTGQIAIGTATTSANNILFVNLPKGSFTFNGVVAGNVLIEGGDCEIGPGAIVKGTITTNGPTAELDVEGTAEGTITGSNIEIGGTGITKDIIITQGGKIKVETGAKVQGSVDASKATEIEIATGTVSGEIIMPSNPEKPISVTGVTLNKPTVSLLVDATETLTATVNPTNAANKNVTWSSSNTAVASVDDKGVVKALKVGTTTITVTTADGGKTAKCEVTVNPILVTGVTLDKNTATLVRAKTETLVATIKPTNATNKNVKWTSSDDTIVSVNDKGMVTAIKVGTATITVTTTDGSKTDKCTITVIDPANPGDITADSWGNVTGGSLNTL